jgi:dipeptidyl-peptidase-4
VNGMTDGAYEEEFDLRDAFRWSPDGAKIAYWRFDMTGLGTYYLVNDTDSLYPRITPIQYPKAGTRNSAVTAGVVSADGGPTTWLQIPDDPRENYLPRLEWAGPNELVLQRIPRLQNTDRVMLADATTGATRAVLTERDSAWVDVVDEITWLAKGTEFLWTSERDGWRHVYRVSRDGKRVTNITPGTFDVVDVAAVDEAGQSLYYIASPDSATQRYLYRTRLDGKGTAVRVSPATAPGTHSYRISPDAHWAFHTYSQFNSPSVIELVQLPSHRVVRSLVDNAKQRAAVAPFTTRPGEFFKVPVADGVTLDGWMIKPANFDSTKTYPLLMYVYGEPAGQTAQDSWGGGHLWEHMIADQGYVVATVDNRGTPSPRGRAWRKVVYGAIGVLSSREQADAVCALTGSRRYLTIRRASRSGAGAAAARARFRPCSATRRLPGRNVRGACAGRAAVRHDLSGALHGSPAKPGGQRRYQRPPDQSGPGTQRPAADRARIRRRQRALSGHGAPGEPPGRARQTLRLHGVSQSLALYLRGPRHDAPRLLAAHPVLAGASPCRAEGPFNGRVRAA